MVQPPATLSDRSVAALHGRARSRFVRRTYAHLLGALLAFTLIDLALVASGTAAALARATPGYGWILVLAAFIAVGAIASRAARHARSRRAQYTALAAFVGLEALLFAPLVAHAARMAPGLLDSAALFAIAGALSLTAVAYSTNAETRTLRPLLLWTGGCVVLWLLASALFGFGPDTGINALTVMLAGVAILYDTSGVIDHHAPTRPAAAALALFTALPLFLWELGDLALHARP